VRVQVEELDRSEELALWQGDDVVYLAERASASGVFDSEGATELKLQGSIISFRGEKTSGLGEATEDRCPAPRIDDQMNSNGGECHAKKNENQRISLRGPPEPQPSRSDQSVACLPLRKDAGLP
jgi:hypothetical protein